LKGENVDINTDTDIPETFDYAVAYKDMKEAYDQLRDDFNAHVHDYNAGPTPATTPTPKTPSTADMSAAKVESVRLPD
jgi:hypothetical protein